MTNTINTVLLINKDFSKNLKLDFLCTLKSRLSDIRNKEINIKIDNTTYKIERKGDMTFIMGDTKEMNYDEIIEKVLEMVEL